MRVAVFGAGYAGLTLARELESELPADAELVVVDEDGSHLVQHELHRVVRRPGLADEIVVDLHDVLDRAIVREATVTDLDTAAGVATLDHGDVVPGTDGEDESTTVVGEPTATAGETRLQYDVGAVCLGAATNYYDLVGVEEHSTPLKRIDHAEQVRADFLDAVAAGDPVDPTRVVVGGAGLSGVQVAGELAALASDEGARESTEVVLLEQEATVAPRFPENFQRAVRDELEARDVRVETGRAVARADDDAITFTDDETMAYEQLVWTGGIRGSDALDGERPVVRNTLRYEDGTFVVGDAGRIVDTNGEAVPASAQAAIREAGVAADNIARLVEHERSGTGGFEPRLDGYRFDSLGWLVSIGDGAVAQVGPTVLRGQAAKALKTSVGAGYLSSVGAVENAVDLVREEVGWPDGEDDDSVEKSETE
ncbi:NAD(P)/FAD-dependent oxidoreductase [Halosimplex salinum]|uniref:NAD(P)/FAD-dependent oxidoreductase n=1 Tax=Halosimplex salinum TaxID=1710538 RepID=UPI000F4A0F34|nr:FAD-dependent oxidoreductase [Halosimplex salinum]